MNVMPIIVWYFIVGVLSLNAFLFWKSNGIARNILQKWATESGHKIINAQRQWLFAGPFTFHWNGQVVLRFQALNEHGTAISGWALCGGPGISFFFDRKIRVQFD